MCIINRFFFLITKRFSAKQKINQEQELHGLSITLSGEQNWDEVQETLKKIKKNPLAGRYERVTSEWQLFMTLELYASPWIQYVNEIFIITRL